MGNKGGRPPLEKDRRSFKIDVRFTEAEYREVEALEKALSLKKAELIRRKVLHDGKGTLLNAVAVLKSLDGISLELARTGNNINQLARYANRLQKHGVLSPKVLAEFLGMMNTHQRQQTEIQQLYRQVLRAMKDR